MTSATMASPDTTAIAPAGGIRFPVASRPQVRFSNAQTVSIIAAGTSFAPIQLPATGWVRKLILNFTFSGACASAGAVVAGDGPWNLINGVTLTDATGQPILQPVNGYNLYLINKYLPSADYDFPGVRWTGSPYTASDFDYSATATTFTASFRLEIDLEQDYRTGYGCVPNLDSNASLQLKIDAAAMTNAFSGTTISAGNLSVTVEQHYWAPVGGTMGGAPVQAQPNGAGDFLETRYENQAVIAAAENTVAFTNRGGLIRGIIVVSRAAGVRTAFTAASNVGLVYDNNAIEEGFTVPGFQNRMRRESGNLGADITTSYAPGTSYPHGIDRGVLCWNFDARSLGRDTWLSTRTGTLLQGKVTPGASATQLEIITRLMQVRSAAGFYGQD
jgi:hypothetical protein